MTQNTTTTPAIIRVTDNVDTTITITINREFAYELHHILSMASNSLPPTTEAQQELAWQLSEWIFQIIHD